MVYTVGNDMWENFVDKRLDNIEYVGRPIAVWLDQHLFNIILILIGTYVLRKFGTKLTMRIMHKSIRHDLYPSELDRRKRIQTLDKLVSAIIRISSIVVAVFMIMSELGFDTAPLLASAGVFGLAIGFGAQSLVKDFVSGMFIISENQYRIGDWVKLDKIEGEVESLTIRTTIIRDLGGDVHYIPNGQIAVVTNKSMDFDSVNEDITVGKDSDMNEVEHIVNHIGDQLAAMPEIKHMITEPPKFTQVKGFDKNGIVFKVLGRTTAGDSWLVKSEFYKKLQKAFDKHGIEVPYNQITVHQELKKK